MWCGVFKGMVLHIKEMYYVQKEELCIALTVCKCFDEGCFHMLLDFVYKGM